MLLLALIGNAAALPLYSLSGVRAGSGAEPRSGRPPTWSLSGLVGTLQYAGAEIREPLEASLVWTAIAATLAALLACALAWASRRSTAWRLVALGTLALTLATPGPVAGMALVLAYRAFPIVYDSPAMIVMAETLRTLPYALLILWPFLRSFPQDYLDAAALDGHGPWGQIVRVVFPLSRRPLLAAWAIAFAIGLGELPATNLAAPPGTPPMSVLIWSLLHTGVESHLAGVALIMLLVVAAAGLFAARRRVIARERSWTRDSESREHPSRNSHSLRLPSACRRQHRLDRLFELLFQVRAAADEQAGDLAVATDDDRLGDRDGLVLVGHDAVAVEGDRHVELLALEQGGDLLGGFLQVDGDEPHVLVFELRGRPLDLRHRLQARAAPGGPEVEHDHFFPLLSARWNCLPAHEVEGEVGGRLADQRRLDARVAAAPVGPVAGRHVFRLGRVLQLPLLVRQLRGGLIDGACRSRAGPSA